MGGDCKTIVLLTYSLDNYSLNDILCHQQQMFIAILNHVRRPSFDINNPANNSQPPISVNGDPFDACNIPSVFPSLPPIVDLKNSPHYPCNDCPDERKFDDDINTNAITTIDNVSDNLQPVDDPPNDDIFSSISPPPPSFKLKHLHHPCDCSNGWEIDDNIINSNNTTTTDISSDSSQPSIFFDNKSDSEFDIDTTSNFIFDLEAKMATDDVTDDTETIVFDDKPDKSGDYTTMILPPTTFNSSFTSSDNNPSGKPTLEEMKSYIYNSVYNTPYLCTAWEDNIPNFNNISTADNSQPPIFSTDITAGQPAWDSNDDDSTTDYDKVYSNDDEYNSFDLLSRSCQKVNQVEGRKHTITPSLLLEDESLEDAD